MYKVKDCRTEPFDTFRNKKKQRKTRHRMKLTTEQFHITFKK